MNQTLAFIHPEAKIAQNVVIEPFAVIQKDVEIGEGSWIGSHATILEGVRIGKNVRIFQGAVIGGIPQDLKFGGEYSTVEIGDNSTIREFVTVNRGTSAHGKTEIGKDCLIMAYSHVAHDCVIGNHVILSNNVQLAGHIIVEDWVIIGGVSAVHQFVKIGQHAFISGGSLVRKDVPPYVKAAREPLSYAGINSLGLQRRGFEANQIAEIQEAYRFLFLRGLNTADATSKIESEIAQSETRDVVINFIKNADRGIIKGPSSKSVEEV